MYKRGKNSGVCDVRLPLKLNCVILLLRSACCCMKGSSVLAVRSGRVQLAYYVAATGRQKASVRTGIVRVQRRYTEVCI